MDHLFIPGALYSALDIWQVETAMTFRARGHFIFPSLFALYLFWKPLYTFHSSCLLLYPLANLPLTAPYFQIPLFPIRVAFHLENYNKVVQYWPLGQANMHIASYRAQFCEGESTRTTGSNFISPLLSFAIFFSPPHTLINLPFVYSPHSSDLLIIYFIYTPPFTTLGT